MPCLFFNFQGKKGILSHITMGHHKIKAEVVRINSVCLKY